MRRRRARWAAGVVMWTKSYAFMAVVVDDVAVLAAMLVAVAVVEEREPERPLFVLFDGRCIYIFIKYIKYK